MSTGQHARTGRRPFTGFDQERAFFARIKGELLATADGLYISIVGDELAGPPAASFEEAVRDGYRAFGPGPLYVRRIGTDDEAVELARNASPCQS